MTGDKKTCDGATDDSANLAAQPKMSLVSEGSTERIPIDTSTLMWPAFDMERSDVESYTSGSEFWHIFM
jgi:hypothetical protein